MPAPDAYNPISALFDNKCAKEEEMKKSIADQFLQLSDDNAISVKKELSEHEKFLKYKEENA